MKSIYIFVFLFFSLTLNGQDGFIQKYNLDHSAALFTNILLHDEASIIVKGIARIDTFPFTQGITFTKLDTNGNILFHTIHIDSLGSDYSFGATPREIYKLNDNSGYLLLGHAFNRSNGIVMKVNNEGEQLWVKEYPDDSTLQDLYRKIIEVDDGFLIIGHKQALDYTLNIFIKKINFEGEELWEKLYGVDNDEHDFADDFITKNDNEFIIGGSTWPNQGVPWQETESSIQIFAIDSLGNQKWYWESDYSLEEIGIRGLNFDDNGNWIYATVKGEYTFDGSLRVQPKLMIRDSNFNIVEEKILGKFAGRSTNHLVDLMPISSGGWLGVGSKLDSIQSLDIDGHIAAWTIKFNELGDSIWERTDAIFPDSLLLTFQYLNSAVELSSGSIIAAGYYKDSNPNVKDWGILIKVDKNGCMDTLFCNPITSLKKEIQFSDPIQVFPNPTDGVVFFKSSQISSWETIELFDFFGKKVNEVYGQNSLQLEGLATGIYLAKLWKDGKYQLVRVIKN